MMNYNELAAAYARNRKINPALLEALLTRAALNERSTVLEVGCGTGNYIETISQTANCSGHGVDPSTEMLAAAYARQPSVAFQLGAAEVLPFDDARFDLIYSVDVIHHVTDVAACYRESFRVLKPGGLLCTATDSVEAIRSRCPLSSHFPETIVVELERYPAIDDLTAAMTASGFHHIEIQEVELPYALADIEPYRQRAFSCLHLIDDNAFERGVQRLETEIDDGPIEALSLYTMIWGIR